MEAETKMNRPEAGKRNERNIRLLLCEFCETTSTGETATECVMIGCACRSGYDFMCVCVRVFVRGRGGKSYGWQIVKSAKRNEVIFFFSFQINLLRAPIYRFKTSEDMEM